MSALANTYSTYPESQKTTVSKAIMASADISVITRIDYNLRFAKQAVLVVGDNINEYSQLANEFLGTLSNGQQADNSHINVAFVPASTQLNDIQVRCRLIEQLFVNTLFDPEQSLAVSLLRFAKEHGEAISIVIDHAHALSLQVKYELSQLVSLAKKHKLRINVVLFGLTDGLQQLADNKSIFKNKLVVIDAKSGQVIGLDDSKKPTEKGSRSLALWQKLSLLGTIVLLLGAIIWVYLLIVDDVNTSFLSSNGTSIKTEKNVVSLTQAEFIESNKAITVREMQSKQKASLTDDVSNTSAENVYSQATSADITQAILTTSSITNTEMVAAQAGDVLQALFVTDIPKGAELTKLTKQVNSPFEQSMVINNQEEKTNNINGIYYQKKAAEYREGYVIQIAGFTENGLWQKFINQNHNINLYSYQRLLSNKKFTVVTSQVFRNKAEAKAAMALLPATLMERKPWLKPISSVITEINTFTR